MSLRRALVLGASGLLGSASLAGCESTQSRSARLERAAKGATPEQGLEVGRRSRDVRVIDRTVLQDANGVAVVVELRNRSRRALAAVPVAIEVSDAGERRLWANDSPGLDDSLVRAPLVPARGRLTWVNDQIPVSERVASVAVRVGADAKRAPVRVPRMTVTRVRLERDPASGIAVMGRVVNRSSVEQRRLVLYVVARRDGRPVAAGRAIVQRLKAGGKSRFTAFVIGNPTGARLEVSAPPSVVSP